MDMRTPQIVSIGEPDEVREFLRGRLEVYRVGGLELGRAIYEPGWRWTEHVRPIAGTELCEVSHVGLVLAGSAAVLMRDGREFMLTPGTFFAIPPGHDSWVVGNEDYLSIHIAGAGAYGAPEGG
jgi:quercetin dioxygenase-like cupin family protein